MLPSAPHKGIVTRTLAAALAAAVIGASFVACSESPAQAAFTPPPAVAFPAPSSATIDVGAQGPGYDDGQAFYAYSSPLPPDAALTSYREQLVGAGFVETGRDGAWHIFQKLLTILGVKVGTAGPPTPIYVRVGIAPNASGTADQSGAAGQSGAGSGTPSLAPGQTATPANGASSPPADGSPTASNDGKGNGNGGGGNIGGNNGGGNSSSASPSTGTGGSGNGGGAGSGNGNGNGGGNNGNNGGGKPSPKPTPNKPDPPHGGGASQSPKH